MALTPDEQKRICAAARSYLGVPWRGQGRDRLGIDCTGLVECAFIDAGMPVERLPATYRGVDSKMLVENLRRYCEKIPNNRGAVPGDIVLYGVPWAAHIAVLVDGEPMNGIHCPINREVVEARFDLSRGDIRGIYRWARFSLSSHS